MAGGTQEIVHYGQNEEMGGGADGAGSDDDEGGEQD